MSSLRSAAFIASSLIPDDLIKAYPNPFRDQTTFEFFLENPSSTSIEVYNSIGERVETIIDNNLQKGTHQIQWNSINLPNGIYHVRLRAVGNFS